MAAGWASREVRDSAKSRWTPSIRSICCANHVRASLLTWTMTPQEGAVVVRRGV